MLSILMDGAQLAWVCSPDACRREACQILCRPDKVLLRHMLLALIVVSLILHCLPWPLDAGNGGNQGRKLLAV